MLAFWIGRIINRPLEKLGQAQMGHVQEAGKMTLALSEIFRTGLPMIFPWMMTY